jgi:hypothetical protein
MSQKGFDATARDAGRRRVCRVDQATLGPWFAGRADGLQPVRYEWLLVAENGQNVPGGQRGTRLSVTIAR